MLILIFVFLLFVLSAKEALTFSLVAVVILLCLEGYLPPTVLAPTMVHPNTPHGSEEEGQR